MHGGIAQRTMLFRSGRLPCGACGDETPGPSRWRASSGMQVPRSPAEGCSRLPRWELVHERLNSPDGFGQHAGRGLQGGLLGLEEDGREVLATQHRSLRTAQHHAQGPSAQLQSVNCFAASLAIRPQQPTRGKHLDAFGLARGRGVGVPHRAAHAVVGAAGLVGHTRSRDCDVMASPQAEAHHVHQHRRLMQEGASRGACVRAGRGQGLHVCHHAVPAPTLPKVGHGVVHPLGRRPQGERDPDASNGILVQNIYNHRQVIRDTINDGLPTADARSLLTSLRCTCILPSCASQRLEVAHGPSGRLLVEGGGVHGEAAGVVQGLALQARHAPLIGLGGPVRLAPCKRHFRQGNMRVTA
mmetsp:Transcript_102091/g.284228  ORF Transcript_102091/g.284228 Transcript_102091/m.284228 type:complete len:356 (-) Transcript_102091:1188-2255(-)